MNERPQDSECCYLLCRPDGALAVVDWKDGLALLLFPTRDEAQDFAGANDRMVGFEPLKFRVSSLQGLIDTLGVDHMLWLPDEETEIHDAEIHESDTATGTYAFNSDTTLPDARSRTRSR